MSARLPFQCPRCESHSPEKHPAMAAGGEVQLCPDMWHLSTIAGREMIPRAFHPSRRQQVEEVVLTLAVAHANYTAELAR